MAQEILDRNLGHVMNDGQRFTTPGVIQIGWILDVPADADATVAPPPTVDAPQPSQETYTVQRGSSATEIADHHLGFLGREPTPREVRGDPQPDGRQRRTTRQPNAELDDLQRRRADHSRTGYHSPSRLLETPGPRDQHATTADDLDAPTATNSASHHQRKHTDPTDYTSGTSFSASHRTAHDDRSH
jgi:hypothetical protein